MPVKHLELAVVFLRSGMSCLHVNEEMGDLANCKQRTKPLFCENHQIFVLTVLFKISDLSDS